MHYVRKYAGKIQTRNERLNKNQNIKSHKINLQENYSFYKSPFLILITEDFLKYIYIFYCKHYVSIIFSDPASAVTQPACNLKVFFGFFSKRFFNLNNA